MNYYEKLQQTMDLLDQLRDEDGLIIVEGKKDTRALNELGITNIQEINKGMNLADFASHVKEKKVIILTDYDRRGEQLKKELNQLFLHEGKKVDTEYRRLLKQATGFKYAEEIPSKIKFLEKESTTRRQN